MEFSYSISLAQAKEAFWLHFWTRTRKIVIGILSIVLIAELWFVVLEVHDDLAAGMTLGQIPGSDSGGTIALIIFSTLFFVLYVFFFVPWRALRPIRKNPSLLRARQAVLNSEQFDVRGQDGSSCLKWSLYKYWREGKNVIILKVVSGQYQAISKTDLSESELEEVRGILGAALPCKK